MNSPTASPDWQGRWASRCLWLYWPTLLLLLHWPSPFPTGREPRYPDKLVHFTAYGILATLLALNVDRRRGPLRRWATSGSSARYLLVFAIVAVVGLVDEFTQPLTQRDFEWLDWVADLGGAVFGILTARHFQPAARPHP